MVDGLERSSQQQDRDVRELRDSLDERRDLVAVVLRHADIREDDVRRRAFDLLRSPRRRR